ncbi:2-dehydro-3-deoxygalactonokinase [Paracoccus sp. Z330]|uniref:2-dehydro-3-deoxygalactonokinase n=1 Tax=Paracoccus onchidii TaxID=3017813 RepID=A0ABT4ZCP7_9RHOB|nr:2-dehydro-3-deoxygalactonokinase [Paracoccus onchidii]MDB6177057.1 2-dehydro-3-deoxygalactonokinase [Paracoccus onchidii]
MNTPAMIAVHSTSRHLHIWILGRDGAVISRHKGDGVGNADHGAMERAILARIGPSLDADARLPVMCSGHQLGGIANAPHVIGETEVLRSLVADSPQLSTINYLPGLAQQRPPALLGGEETAIAGFLAGNEKFDGVVLCLAETQSSWVHVSANEVVSFRNFLTPEMMGLLAGMMSLTGADASDTPFDEGIFSEAVEQTMSRPAAIAADIASLGAEIRLSGLARNQAFVRLAGLLIGAEMAAARPYWLGQQVALIGDGSMVRFYRSALASQGLPVKAHSHDSMILAGLAKALKTSGLYNPS